jgi:hypothetical protein
VIDLHLHTTASDGRSSPAALVAEVRAAGITAFAVTDHDTVAALAEVRALAGREGLEFIGGIEISAVRRGDDVHVLGYGFDEESPRLLEFLRAQRADRLARAAEMGRRLAELGLRIDVDAVVGDAGRHGARSIGRPALADALVRGGYVASRKEAFDRFLGRERPAYVPRPSPSPREAVQVLVEAGALTSIAHPGLMKHDDFLERLPGAGLAALEVYHPDHDAARRAKYGDMATRLGLLRTGGSDYHGPDHGRDRPLGKARLPRVHYERLLAEGRRLGCARLPRRPLGA